MSNTIRSILAATLLVSGCFGIIAKAQDFRSIEADETVDVAENFSASQSGFYCIAWPSYIGNGHGSRLPGYGHGRTMSESMRNAEASCRSRNSSHQSSCRASASNCFRE